MGYVTMNARDRDEVGVVDAERVLPRLYADGEVAGGVYEYEPPVLKTRSGRPEMILVRTCLLMLHHAVLSGFERWSVAAMIYFGVFVSASGGFIMLSWWS